MSAYVILLTGCSEKLLVEVEAHSLADLAQELSCTRFLVGQMIAADG